VADNVTLNTGSGGDTIAADEIGGVKHQRVKVEFGADGSATDASPANPLPVGVGLNDPKTTLATGAVLAAGASTDLDSAQVSVGKTAKLVGVVMASSVALKGVLKTVANAVESADLAVFFSRPGEAAALPQPDKRFFAAAHDAGAGFDGFRLSVTNLDTGQAADAYATFYYDEE
jgi:hypothetical protein